MLRPELQHTLLATVLSVVGWMPASPSVAVDWQIARVRVNGVTLDLRSGDVAVDQPALAAAVAARWRGAEGKPAAAVSRSTLTDGRVVFGRQRGHLHQTIMLHSHAPGRTRVLVAVNDLREAAVTPARPPIRLPAGQRLMQVIEHGDGGVAPRTFVIASADPPRNALSGWRRALTAAGWSLRSVDPAGAGPPAWLLWADRGSGHIDAVFSPAPDGARIVLQVSGDVR